MPIERSQLEDLMKRTFESGLEIRLERAQAVRLQTVIPNHWFSAAASECARMYISGFFYGAISVSQSTVEAMSRYLERHHHTKRTSDIALRWRRLADGGFVSGEVVTSAAAIWDAARNDFHHLNTNVPTEYHELEQLARDCVNNLHAIESYVFAHSFDQGVLIPKKPEYWPLGPDGLAIIYLRNVFIV